MAPPAKTVSFLAYDDEALYVAFAADDPEPSAIRAPLVDRDKVLGDQDYVAILLDTLNDRRSGVAFRVNPRGVQTDSLVNDATGGTYPTKVFSYFRPCAGVEYDGGYEDNAVLRRGLYQGFELEGKWGSSGWLTAQYEDERVGSALLHRNYVEFSLKAAPKRWLPAIQFDGSAGQKLDYAGARVGTGANLNLSSTLRATDHLELQLKTSREWLDVDDARLFDAKIDWLKLTYTFSARSRTLSGLYSWKLNWQTVFFVGYGDASITSSTGSLAPETRSLFMKVAYAFQR